VGLGDDGSNGSCSRLAIDCCVARIATGLRTVQRAYWKVTEREAASESPDLATALRSTDHFADRKIDLE
jgi:hypothetical protein